MSGTWQAFGRANYDLEHHAAKAAMAFREGLVTPVPAKRLSARNHQQVSDLGDERSAVSHLFLPRIARGLQVSLSYFRDDKTRGVPDHIHGRVEDPLHRLTHTRDRPEAWVRYIQRLRCMRCLGRCNG